MANNYFVLQVLSGLITEQFAEQEAKLNFFAKLSITIEEADESLFWLEILVESQIVTENKLADLMKEAEEIIKVLSKARKNTN